jgi:4-amino-4-deoxy-L-arabinose transferase-like glycosyltransferase
VSGDRDIVWARYLPLVIVVSLLMRVGAVAPLHEQGYTSDEREYVYIAQKVSSESRFIDSNSERSKRSPLFPVTLAFVFRAFGSSLVVPHVINILLGTIIVVLGYALCIRIGSGHHVALLASATMAVYPGLVIYSGLLQTESLYMVFVLLGFIFAYRSIDDPGLLNPILLGLASGIAALTRAVFFGFFPVLLLLVGWMRRQHHQKALGHVLVALLVYCAVLSPWIVRNYHVHGAFVPLSSFGGSSLLIGNNPFATGTWSLKEGFEEWFTKKAGDRGIANVQGLTEVEQSALWSELAVEHMMSHPLETFQLGMKKLYIFWIYPVTHSSSNVPLQAVAVASDFVLLLGVGVGVVGTWVVHGRFAPLYAAVIFFSAVQAVLHSEARYRLPLVPVLCIVFAYGVNTAVYWRRARTMLSIRTQRVTLIALLMVVVLLYAYTGWLFLRGSI